MGAFWFDGLIPVFILNTLFWGLGLAAIQILACSLLSPGCFTAAWPSLLIFGGSPYVEPLTRPTF
ncbi:hypothetical protein ACQWF7_25160, partial [Salmonella enterica subsp. enterica serovar Infantis]